MVGNAYLGAGDEKGQGSRLYPRKRLTLETIGSLPSGQEANVTVHNVSASGLLIETELDLRDGEILMVDLPQSGALAAQVTWSSAPFFGCKFDHPISAAILSAMQLRGTAPRDDIPQLPGGLRSKSNTVLGKQLEQLRKARGMTLADVAGQLGVSKPTVWAWEKGKARPVESRLPAIAKALEISTEELAAMAVPPAVNDLLESSRRKIADAFGTAPEKVRIMIEL